jgi:hypothetical protein
MTKDINHTFQEKIYECDKHKQKILDAKEFLTDIIPLNTEQYLDINKIESSFIDQLIYRFSKLQDTLGESLFKGILILSKEDVKKMTFLDILNRLEELEIVEKNDWIRLREIRNEATHEYSFNQEEVVDSINLIYHKSEYLLQTYQKIKEFVKIRFEIG